MMRWIGRLLLLLIVGALGLGVYGYFRVTGYLDAPLGAASERRTVEIPKGASFKATMTALTEAGVVTDPLVFEGYARFEKATADVKAGVYDVEMGALTPRDLLRLLAEGAPAAQLKLTIPEGLNKWEIADLLAEKGIADRAAFLAKVEAEGLEGRLFPDTYMLPEQPSLDQIVGRLTGRFDEIFSGLDGAEGLDAEGQRRALILASLVEKEARVAEERPIIARVFENRLEKGMKLQTDPTCVYGPKIYKERAHPRFCRDPESRYSTYMIEGLPPTPIANPGAAALQAALKPAEDARSKTLLFFAAKQDGSGRHAFSATYDEHKRAVNTYLRRRR